MPEVDVVADRRAWSACGSWRRRRPQRAAQQVGGAAEHDLAQVEGADDGRQRGAQPAAGRGEDASRRCRVGRLRPWRVALPERGPDEPVSRQPLRPHAHAGAASCDDDVADLAAPRGAAAEQRAVEDQPGADALADRDTIRPLRRRVEACSPSAAVLASLATCTGRSSSACEAWPRAADVGPAEVRRCRTTPSGSTTPASSPMPTPRTVGSPAEQVWQSRR